MEVRSALEEAKEEDDLVELREDNDEEQGWSVLALERAFEEDDLGAAKREAVKLRYWVNIGEAIRDWEKGKRVEIVH